MPDTKICLNCGNKMEQIPDTPLYACAWCERQVTGSGLVIAPGKRKE